jgi:nucleoid DNA-binding protein
MKITLQDIIDKVADQSGNTKKISEDFIREFFDIIEEALNKDEIAKVKGLGTFKRILVEERKSVNVQTGNEIIIPQHYKVTFAPDKDLKAEVNKPYSHLETYILSKDGPVDQLESEEEEDDDMETEEEIAVEEKVITLESAPKKDLKEKIPGMEKQQNIPVREERNIWQEKKDPEKVAPENNEEKQENIPPTEEETEDVLPVKKKKRWPAILLILFLIGLAAIAVYWLANTAGTPLTDETETEVTPEPELQEEILLEDYMENSETFPVEANLFDTRFAPALVDFMEENYPKMKLTTTGTPDEAVILPGQRLTLLALRNYGNKQFWVYIYLYNTDVISNPNNVPQGTRIKIPKLDPSLANPDNPEHIRVAREIQNKLLNM